MNRQFCSIYEKVKKLCHKTLTCDKHSIAKFEISTPKLVNNREMSSSYGKMF